MDTSLQFLEKMFPVLTLLQVKEQHKILSVYNVAKLFSTCTFLGASLTLVAPLDACQTADQEVVGSTVICCD